MCEVGLALGLTLADVARLSVAELNIWRTYRERHGFPSDRMVWAILNGSAYVGGTWGGKAKPADLAPRFQRPARVHQTTLADIEAFKAWFAARSES